MSHLLTNKHINNKRERSIVLSKIFYRPNCCVCLHILDLSSVVDGKRICCRGDKRDSQIEREGENFFFSSFYFWWNSSWKAEEEEVAVMKEKGSFSPALFFSLFTLDFTRNIIPKAENHKLMKKWWFPWQPHPTLRYETKKFGILIIFYRHHNNRLEIFFFIVFFFPLNIKLNEKEILI